MKAIILSAGRGERMRPLTDNCPKPMLKVNGLPLIEHHINRLKKAGITDIVINHAWLGGQIEDYFAAGDNWQVNITYSAERSGGLETAGGILKALPLLIAPKSNEDKFLVVNGDIYCDFDFNDLPELNPDIQAHLFLVDNPEHNPDGDFAITDGLLKNKQDNVGSDTFTYSGIGVYHIDFFNEYLEVNGPLALGPLLREKALSNKLSASVIDYLWTDVGTPERLNSLNENK